MKDYLENVDRISRNSLQEWEVPPPSHIADKVRRRMAWTNFWRSRSSRFLMAGFLVLLLTTGSILLVRETGQLSPASAPLAGLNLSDVPAMAPAGDPALSVSMPSATTTPNTPDLRHANQADPSSHSNSVTKNPVNSDPVLDFASNDPSTVTLNPLADEHNALTISQHTETPTDATTSDGTSALSINSSENRTVRPTMHQQRTDFGSISSMPLQGLPLLSSAFSEYSPHRYNDPPVKKHKAGYSLQLDLMSQLPGLGEKKQGDLRSEPSMLTGSAALTLQVNFRKWFIESGFQYTQLQTRQEADWLTCNPHDLTSLLLIGQELDTINTGYWHVRWIQDSMIHAIDSVWVAEVDSNYTDLFEETHTTVYDTLNGPAWKTRITLFEIPLGIGYRFYACRTEFNLRAGILFGFGTKTIGHTYLSESSAGLVQMSEAYSEKGMQYSCYLSAAIGRNLDEHWTLLFTPSWRTSLNGLQGREGLADRRYSAWGLGIGLRYEF